MGLWNEATSDHSAGFLTGQGRPAQSCRCFHRSHRLKRHLHPHVADEPSHRGNRCTDDVSPARRRKGRRAGWTGASALPSGLYRTARRWRFRSALALDRTVRIHVGHVPLAPRRRWRDLAGRLGETGRLVLGQGRGPRQECTRGHDGQPGTQYSRHRIPHGSLDKETTHAAVNSSPPGGGHRRGSRRSSACRRGSSRHVPGDPLE